MRYVVKCWIRYQQKLTIIGILIQLFSARSQLISALEQNLLIKYLFSIYYVPGTVLDTGDIIVK